MSVDLELESWRAEWKRDEAVPADLRKKVQSQSRLMRVALGCDVLVTVVMGGGITGWALMRHDEHLFPVAMATWTFLAIAWIFVLTANRGLWTPSSLDAATFVDLAVRRCRSALAATWFAGGLFFAEVAFGLGWVYEHSPKGQSGLLLWLLFGSIRVDVVWVVTIVFIAGLLWYRKKKRSELRVLLRVREETSGEPANSQADPKVSSYFFGLRGTRRKKSYSR